MYNSTSTLSAGCRCTGHGEADGTVQASSSLASVLSSFLRRPCSENDDRCTPGMAASAGFEAMHCTSTLWSSTLHPEQVTHGRPNNVGEPIDRISRRAARLKEPHVRTYVRTCNQSMRRRCHAVQGDDRSIWHVHECHVVACRLQMPHTTRVASMDGMTPTAS